MVFFTWDDAYDTGIGEIDRQHRKLVLLLNELYEAMYAGKGRNVLGNVLNDLLAYTRTHFLTEEQFMRNCSYPGYQEHRQIHEKMRNRVVLLLEQYQNREISSPVQISNFLKNWLFRHILETDKKFAAFYKSENTDQYKRHVHFRTGKSHRRH